MADMDTGEARLTAYVQGIAETAARAVRQVTVEELPDKPALFGQLLLGLSLVQAVPESVRAAHGVTLQIAPKIQVRVSGGQTEEPSAGESRVPLRASAGDKEETEPSAGESGVPSQAQRAGGQTS